jgi:hypothetical protein
MQNFARPVEKMQLAKPRERRRPRESKRERKGRKQTTV